MQALAQDNKIEAYVLPGEVIMQLMRDVAAKRPGLITHVGLGTFVDPRLDDDRMNAAAKDDLVTLIQIDDREYLRYLPVRIDVALLRGSFADDDGNISLDQESANVDIYAIAAATHNSGGKVIFQVKGRVRNGELAARSVRVPSAIVDAVVVDEAQRQGYDLIYDPAISGVQAVSGNQNVLYVTERCVFERKPDGVHLIEVAPGIDIEADILSRMAFRPVVNPPIQIMSSAHFTEHRP